MSKAVEYLRETEFSMGNGQCPKCHGVSKEWFGHPLYLTAETVGHKEECSLAQALKELGEEVLFIGGLKSDIEYETCWVKCYDGEMTVLSTKVKT